MKILMLVNWKIQYCESAPIAKQPPDYYVKNEDYWFFRYFVNKPEVDVVDISSFPWLESFEKNKLHFYIWQALKVIPKLNDYDLIVSHGMPSGIVISLWRRLFRTKAKQVVFDIGSFASGSESGIVLKLMQFASKSIDGLIYHTSWQKGYYEKYFPWIVDKSKFILFGSDFDYNGAKENGKNEGKYIVCPGQNLSDWKVLVDSFLEINSEFKLHLIGGVNPIYENIPNIVQKPYLSTKDYIEEILHSCFVVLPLIPVKFSFGQMRMLQAMALGKAVIASKIVSLTDYLIDGETGLFFEPGNGEDLKEKILFLLINDAERERLASNAKHSVSSMFSEEKMAINIENFLQDLLSN